MSIEGIVLGTIICVGVVWVLIHEYLTRKNKPTNGQ
ncbi:hypothetical protein fHeYen902_269 [Yersinia phage fHe-Yen9-02]|nr:hypothetical protein fHeYen902_269 [Yersinia phage fHe-Yen9-02]